VSNQDPGIQTACEIPFAERGLGSQVDEIAQESEPLSRRL
jgi:hypothetical protein